MIFVDGVCVSVMRTPLCSGYPSLLPCPDPEIDTRHFCGFARFIPLVLAGPLPVVNCGGSVGFSLPQ